MYTLTNLLDDIKKLSEYRYLSAWVEDGVLSSTSSTAPYGEEDDLIDMLSLMESELRDLLLDYGAVVNESTKSKLAKHDIHILSMGDGIFSLKTKLFKIEF